MKELWRPIEGYSLYEISNLGKIRNVQKNIIRKTKISNEGYEQITLVRDDGKKKYLTVHRLVALTFIPNPDNLPEVDHIDRDKLNNNVDNLRWVTKKENMHNREYEPIKHGNGRLKQPVRQLDLDGNEIAV